MKGLVVLRDLQSAAQSFFVSSRNVPPLVWGEERCVTTPRTDVIKADYVIWGVNYKDLGSWYQLSWWGVLITVRGLSPLKLYVLNRLIHSYRLFYESSRYLAGFPKAYLFSYSAAHWETAHCKYMSQKTIAFWAMSPYGVQSTLTNSFAETKFITMLVVYFCFWLFKARLVKFTDWIYLFAMNKPAFW